MKNLLARLALRTVIFATFCCAFFAGQFAKADNEPLYYVYHGQQKALTLDTEHVAVRVSPSMPNAQATGAGLPMSLVSRGLTEADVVARPEADWMIVNAQSISGATSSANQLASPAGAAQPNAATIHATINSMLNSGDPSIEFVSPVFRDARGGPIIVMPTILIGFKPNFAAKGRASLRASVPEGATAQQLEVSQSNAEQWQIQSRDGFEVLSRANALASTPGVAYAEPDMLATAYSNLVPSDPNFGDSWGLNNTGQSGGKAGFDMEAPAAWDITTGSASVIVMIIDCGIQQDHPDLNQITGKDFTSDAAANPNGGPFGQYDSHGTWVAGCVSSKINNGLGSVGIAPGVVVASARCHNHGTANGTFNVQSSWVVNALNWGQSIGARVTNNSNEYGFSSSAIDDAYASTRTNGMVHFAAAGNDSDVFISYPSSSAAVNAVGAATRQGGKAYFSNIGTGLKFMAPGTEIFTTDRSGSFGGSSGDYITVDGTSFASPYAAGVAALIISQDPSVTASDVETRMQAGCTDMAAAGYDQDTGYGLVDAYRSLREITSALFVSAWTGTQFSYQIQANNNPTAFSSSQLPTGLTLNSQTGLITGVPTLSGIYAITLSATSNGKTVSGTLHLQIDAPANFTLLKNLNLGDQLILNLVTDPVRNRIYGSVRTSNSIVVIDLDSLSITQTIPVGGGPLGMCVSRDGSKLWAANNGSGDVSVVDLTNLTAQPSLALPPENSNNPWSCVLTPDRKLLVGFAQFHMDRLDVDTGTMEASFNTFMYEPQFALSPDQKTLYSGDHGSSPPSLHRFDLVNDMPVQSNSLTAGPYLSASSDGNFVYSFADINNNSILTKYDAANLVTIQQFPQPASAGPIVLNGDGSILYEAAGWSANGEVDTFDTQSYQTLNTFPLNLPSGASNTFADLVIDRTGEYLVLASYTQASQTYGELRIFSTGRANVPNPPQQPKSLVNVSTRTFVQTGDNVEIGGFIIQGDQPKKVVLRAVGPSLAQYGLAAVTDPVLELHDSTGAIVATNDNWNSHRQDVIATGLAPSDEHEAAIAITLAPGAYTAVLKGLNGATGTALFELYDVDPSNSRIANISTRANVGTGDNVMIGGFIIGGDQPTSVMIRGIGPSLTQYGVSGALQDPVLELHDNNGTLIVQNDDWRSDQEQAIIATGLQPTYDQESAIMATLQPGNYTAIVHGKSNTTGVALVEIYNLESN